MKKSRENTRAKFGIEESYKLMKKNLSRKKSGDVREKPALAGGCLNVEMLKNSEKVSKLKKNLIKMRESLARNPGYYVNFIFLSLFGFVLLMSYIFIYFLFISVIYM